MYLRNTLWVLFTVAVSFWVGVLFARIFPEFGVAGKDLGSVAEWVTAFAAVWAALIGWQALGSWQHQLKGATKHTVAHEIATAARALRYAFYDARSPLIFAYEWPPDYFGRPIDYLQSNDQKAKDYTYTSNGRLKVLWPYILKLVELRPKAGATLGDPVADSVEALARKVQELQTYMSHQAEMLRQGGLRPSQWTDHDKRTATAITVDLRSKSDEFSLEFEACLTDLMGLLAPHMG